MSPDTPHLQVSEFCVEFVVFSVEGVDFSMEFIVPLGSGYDEDEDQLYDVAQRQQEGEREGVQFQPETQQCHPQELKNDGSGDRLISGDGLTDGFTDPADHGHLQASVGRPHHSQ